jgi:hypothetical protein
MAMQMRFLQTLTDIGAENSTTIVFPVPIDLFSIFMKSDSGGNGQPRYEAPEGVGRTRIPAAT